jgi:polyferredoxin
MTRRSFFALPLAPATARAGFGDWRLHVMARHVCAHGPVLTLALRGQIWKLTGRERSVLHRIARQMDSL